MASRRQTAHCQDSKLYDEYYLRQVGSGLPVFSGTRVQRGHGLGNIFSGLVRAAMPLVKSGLNVLGKEGAKTGLRIAGDVLRGQKPRQAARRHTAQAGKQLLTKTLHQFLAQPPGHPAKRKGTKRPAQHQSVSSFRASKQSRLSKDIFS